MIAWRVNQTQIAQVRHDLAAIPGAADRALCRAINKTLTGLNTDVSKEVRKIYNLKASVVKADFRIYRATYEQLGGKFVASGKPQGLNKFSPKQNKRGVSVKIMKAEPRKTVKHAFIWNNAVFRRQRQDNGRLVGRLPILYLTGPRVEDALAKPEVLSRVQSQADARFTANAEHEVDYILSSINGGGTGA